MQVTLKLFASLSQYLPKHAKRNEIQVDVPEGITVAEMIEIQNLPNQLVHLVLLNGHFIAPDKRATTIISENDALALCPPVAGG
jgi:thiamine biosynthesis protein ThiS